MADNSGLWDDSLLRTKLQIPKVSSGIIVRPRLMQIFREGLERALTLVSAPAGFGKTTSVSVWIRNVDHPVAWLSLDKGDNNPVRFWQYIIAALGTINPEVGNRAKAVFDPFQVSSLERGIGYLINDILITIETDSSPEKDGQVSVTPWMLVLDDYHVIDNEQIHHSLNYFLDNLPPNLHVIITTRADPPLDLSRRRGRQTMVEVRTSDLAFSLDEMEQYLNAVMGLELTTEQISSLEKRSEGWIVGLKMAAAAMKPTYQQERGASQTLEIDNLRRDKIDAFVQEFTGGDRYIGEYLVNEVLKTLPEDVQRFLSLTSILDRFCGSLCDEIVRYCSKDGAEETTNFDSLHLERNSYQILDYLDHTNTFIIPVAARLGWYRYHPLFGDLLRQRLLQTFGRDRIRALHHQASLWFERNGYMEEAVTHSLAAEEFQRAADMLQQSLLVSGFYRREMAFVINWLGKIPENLILTHPALCIADAWHQSTQKGGDFQLPMQRLEVVQRLLGQDRHSLSESQVSLIEAQIVTLRVVLAKLKRVSWLEVSELTEHALACIKEEDNRLRGLLYLNLGQAYLGSGDISSANYSLAEARRVAGIDDDLNTIIWAAYIQANIIKRQGRLNEAATTFRQVTQTINRSSARAYKSAPICGALFTGLGRILVSQNNLGEGEQLLEEGVALLELTHEPLLLCDGYMALARLKSVVGEAKETMVLLEKVANLFPGGEVIVKTERVRHWLRSINVDPSSLSAVQLWVEEQSLELDKMGEIPAVFQEGEWLYEKATTLARAQVALSRIEGSSNGHGKLEKVLDFIAQQIHLAKTSGWMERVGELLILQSVAYDAIEEREQALVSLDQAFKYFESHNYLRAFLDEGEAMAGLLYLATRQARLPNFTRNLLPAFEIERGLIGNGIVGYQDGHEKVQGVHHEIIDPLSNRETEVLQLIASGFSNREIAQELVIAPGTVKVHINHIYNKLRVHKRTQAVAKGRFYGILTHM